MTDYAQQWEEPSSSGNGTYTVSRTVDDRWLCACIGWTRHMPRKDCSHIRKVKARQSGINSPVKTTSGVTVWTPQAVRAAVRAAERAQKPSELAKVLNSLLGPGPVITKAAALKAGATPEQATDAARAKREEVEAKKATQLGKMRYGFQLAEEPKMDELTVTKPMVLEVKYDGHLAMLIDGRIINRSGRDITNRFPEIGKVNGEAVLVGELIVPDEKGLGDFSGGIQTRNTDNPDKIRALAATRPALFVAFDILEVAGEDVTRMPFKARRTLLEAFFKHSRDSSRGVLARHMIVTQMPVNSKADIIVCRDYEASRGGEGVMVKDLEAPYVAKRGRNWMKVKTWQDREFTVQRFEETGVGDGFVVYINNKGREQTVVMNDHKMRAVVRSGKPVTVEVKFLSEGEDGALRFPSVRRIVA
jgi:ATP-dependent DNA ligase